MPSIIIEKGRDKGRFIQLPKEGMILFGRSEECDVVLDDTLTSRRHFSIEGSSESYRIIDQESQNGVFLNGERISAESLKYGDEIFVGSTLLSYVSDSEALERGGLFGEVIGGYKIERRLGRGGMGTVYLARQLLIDREVALKILSPRLKRRPGFSDLFSQEARSIGQLNHPNVVSAYDFGEDKGFLYLVMEYLPGGSMEDLLNHTDRILPVGALSMIIDAAKGLEYAEKQKIIHRDIKPENLLLDNDGLTKIADLGIAIRLDASLAEKKKVIGTPHYMAPEQALGMRLDHRADIYALGGTLYRMLSGRLPFDGESFEEISEANISQNPPPLHSFVEDVSPDLSRTVQRMMAKSLEKRPANFTILLEELNHCLKLEIGEHNNISKPLTSCLSQRAVSSRRYKLKKDQRKDRGRKARPLHVLVVDDEDVIRRLLCDFLKLLGCTAVTARDGVQGVSLFRKGQFDLVLTDRIMPRMNGDKFAKEIRSISSRVPIVMLTGLGMKMRASGVRPKCVDLVLSKPITLKRLKRALQLVVDGKD